MGRTLGSGKSLLQGGPARVLGSCVIELSGLSGTVHGESGGDTDGGDYSAFRTRAHTGVYELREPPRSGRDKASRCEHRRMPVRTAQQLPGGVIRVGAADGTPEAPGVFGDAIEQCGGDVSRILLWCNQHVGDAEFGVVRTRRDTHSTEDRTALLHQKGEPAVKRLCPLSVDGPTVDGDEVLQMCCVVRGDRAYGHVSLRCAGRGGCR